MEPIVAECLCKGGLDRKRPNEQPQASLHGRLVCCCGWGLFAFSLSESGLNLRLVRLGRWVHGGWVKGRGAGIKEALLLLTECGGGVVSVCVCVSVIAVSVGVASQRSFCLAGGCRFVRGPNHDARSAAPVRQSVSQVCALFFFFFK
jgi:hypothetical protein